MRLCRPCDVFIGFGAVGVVHRPIGETTGWLADHCWVCRRSTDDIAAAGDLVYA